MKTKLTKKELAAAKRTEARMKKDLIKRGLLRVEFDFSGKVQSASLEPGDILVFSTYHLLTKEQVVSLREQAQERFPDHQCIILTAGMMLNVFRPEPPIARAETGAAAEPAEPPPTEPIVRALDNRSGGLVRQ
jgi:hypothetical protein